MQRVQQMLEIKMLMRMKTERGEIKALAYKIICQMSYRSLLQTQVSQLLQLTLCTAKSCLWGKFIEFGLISVF